MIKLQRPLTSLNSISSDIWVGTDFERDSNKRSLVDFYSIAFLDKYVKGSTAADCTEKRAGIVELESK